MLFNSYEYIFIFLPIVLIGYFVLINFKYTETSKLWLVGSSLTFYSIWNVIYLPLILLSVIFNYTISSLLSQKNNGIPISKKMIFIIGVVFNICLLGFFKYADFFISSYNYISSSDLRLLNIVLPLAISFFTIQQIAYLSDRYVGIAKKENILNYSLFVTFFPQLVAGPIVHHKEMMPQFKRKNNLNINYKNITLGLFIFSIGLFKKVVIADSFVDVVASGYASSESLSLVESWMVSLSYTSQLYFDFSGYADMAIGSALLFNIKLPINFNSPYKATSISVERLPFSGQS